MDDEARLMAYSAMVETDRKWVSVMDTKAGFVCGLNTLLLAFVWTSAKLGESDGVALCMAWLATGLSVLSLFVTLKVILPRSVMRAIFGEKANYAEGFRPMSFYGYVATTYKPNEESQFADDLMRLSRSDLIREAIEQHFTISHLLMTKSKSVEVSGWLWSAAVIATIAAIATRG